MFECGADVHQHARNAPSQQSTACAWEVLRAHLIHGRVEGKELSMPVGSPGFLVLPLKLLSADMPQQVLQAGIGLQAAQVKVTGGRGSPGGVLRERGHVSGPRLLENEGTAKPLTAQCGLDFVRFLLTIFHLYQEAQQVGDDGKYYPPLCASPHAGEQRKGQHTSSFLGGHC